jgi:hypothetical protein
VFGFKKKKDKQDELLAKMDGREIKYVTRRVRDEEGNVKEVILGKTGRVVVIDGEIRVMCGETDVFRCMAEDATYYTLLSGDGITVSGVNTVNGEQMDIIVYYSYYRK